MWSQGNFKRAGDDGDHMPSFAEKTAALGYGHAEINYVIPPAGVEALLECGHVGFSSVHSPCPRVKSANGRWSEALNLAADDEDERREAVAVARASVDTAVLAGVSLLVVHLGGIGSAIFDEEKRLRKLFDEGGSGSDEWSRLVEGARERRAENRDRYYPHARRSLAEIGDYAAPRGVTVGLENRYHFHEFPDPDEVQELIADYPPEVAGFWLDVGHAEVLDRLGFHPHTRWLDEAGQRCVGTHVHDVDGLADHRAPGHGTTDWPHYAAKLPRHIPRIFEINQRQDEERVANAIPFLRSVGVLPAE